MMLTSGGRSGDATRCRDLGFAAYLHKPVRRAELYRAILAALGSSSEASAVPIAEPLANTCRPLQILLVEDNPVNQRVAVSMLEKQGHSLKVANNGLEALAALDQQDFDVVLMDMQMPEMDGLEATAEIRRRERQTTRHIPIIAMTAAAMKGDRERCLQAGMDGYVSKPFRIRELNDAIRRFVMTPIASDEAPVHANNDEPVSNAVLNWGAALVRTGGDESLLKEVAGIFLGEYSHWMDQIRDAIDHQNAIELKQVAHTLRGSLSTFEAETAVSVTERLELMGRTNQLHEAEATYKELQQAVQQFTAALERKIQS